MPDNATTSNKWFNSLQWYVKLPADKQIEWTGVSKSWFRSLNDEDRNAIVKESLVPEYGQCWDTNTRRMFFAVSNDAHHKFLKSKSCGDLYRNKDVPSFTEATELYQYIYSNGSALEEILQ